MLRRPKLGRRILRRRVLVTGLACALAVTGAVTAVAATATSKPTVSALSVTSSPLAGGTRVMITGHDFTAVTKVQFGGAVGGALNVASATKMYVTAPRHAAGTIDVTVFTKAGRSAPVIAGKFTYVSPPSVTSLTPASGPTAGGTRVMVTGTDFTKVTSVLFGTTPGTALNAASATKLYVTAPPLAAGRVSIRMVTAYGTSPIVDPDHFTYEPPAVSVNFASAGLTHDPAAIGTDESALGSPDDSGDPTAQSELKALHLGYVRLALRLKDPNDPTSAIICNSGGCDHSVSADTWMNMIKATGATPIVEVLHALPPADAAAIVKHFNVTTHNRVDTWLIGNEPNLEQGVTGASYSADFNALYDAMKAVDPTIKIGGGTTASYANGFLTQFLAGSGSRVDFVDFHFYGTSDLQDQPTLVARLPVISGYLTTARALINQMVPDRASQIGIQVGEWNISYREDPIGYTGFAAMWQADVIGRILSAGAVTRVWGTKTASMSIIYYKVHAVEMPPAGFVQDTPMPLYEAISMYTGAGLFPHFGTTMAVASSAISGVDVFASQSPREIVLVNTNGTAVNAPVNIAGGGSLSAAVWQIHQAGAALPAAPAHVRTLTTSNGWLTVSLPAQSVTTLVIS
jgi:hypothetical protein